MAGDEVSAPRLPVLQPVHLWQTYGVQLAPSDAVCPMLLTSSLILVCTHMALFHGAVVM